MSTLTTAHLAQAFAVLNEVWLMRQPPDNPKQWLDLRFRALDASMDIKHRGLVQTVEIKREGK